MSSRSFFRGLFWSLIAILLVAHIGGGWYFSSELIAEGFEPTDEPADEVAYPDAMQVSYESPVGIHVHGKDAGPARMEFLFEPIQEAGYPQLSINYRNDFGQPPDPSGYLQYGATEWEDIEGAVEFARSEGAEAIIFNGFSNGASHVLSYGYRNSLDEVRGLMLDAPNIDFGDTVEYNAGQRELPLIPMNVPASITWVAKFITSLRIDVNWKSLDYVTRAETSLRVPALVHHTKGDDWVPISQSIRFAEAQPDLVRLVQYEGDVHHGSYEAYPEKYEQEVLEFLRENS